MYSSVCLSNAGIQQAHHQLWLCWINSSTSLTQQHKLYCLRRKEMLWTGQVWHTSQCFSVSLGQSRYPPRVWAGCVFPTHRRVESLSDFFILQCLVPAATKAINSWSGLWSLSTATWQGKWLCSHHYDLCGLFSAAFHQTWRLRLQDLPRLPSALASARFSVAECTFLAIASENVMMHQFQSTKTCTNTQAAHVRRWPHVLGPLASRSWQRCPVISDKEPVKTKA